MRLLFIVPMLVSCPPGNRATAVTVAAHHCRLPLVRESNNGAKGSPNLSSTRLLGRRGPHGPHYHVCIGDGSRSSDQNHSTAFT
ncbi:hypothetical protein EDB80DRAFT_728031 [Ilyonectria destructans]|nr:hypothetical protein EDB80DRAFT_728031 [Ilyonectria destructans]